MPAAPLPKNEDERHASLRALNILDRKAALDFGVFPELATQACGAPIAAISLVDTDRQWFMASVGLTETETPRSASFCAHAILNPGEVLHVPDATEDPRFADNPLVVGDFGLRAYAGASILGPGGHPIGALCVIDTQVRDFSNDALGRLARLASQVSNALKLHGALEDLRRQESERSVIQSILASMLGNPDIPVLVARASGALLLGNEALHALSGYAATELPKLLLRDLIIQDDEAGKEAPHVPQNKANAGASGGVLRHKSGARIPVHVTSASVRLADTQMLRVLTLHTTRSMPSAQPGWSGTA